MPMLFNVGFCGEVQVQVMVPTSARKFTAACYTSTGPFRWLGLKSAQTRPRDISCQGFELSQRTRQLNAFAYVLVNILNVGLWLCG